MVIDQNSNEMRQLQSKLKSQETSIAYFKRQIGDLEEQLESEKSEKQALKRQMQTDASVPVREVSEPEPRITETSSIGKQDGGLDSLKMLLTTANEAMGIPQENADGEAPESQTNEEEE